MPTSRERRQLVLPSWCEPEDVFRRVFADDPWACWLDSGQGAETGVSLMGRGTERLVADAVLGTVEHVSVASRSTVRRGSLLESLRALRAGVPGDPGDWVGWFGYEFGAGLVGAPAREASLPAALMLRVDDQVRFDHAARTVTLSSADPEWLAWVAERVKDRSPLPRTTPEAGGVCLPRHADRAYVRLVEACQEHIRRGDAYQLCLTNTLRVDGVHDPLATYLRLRAMSPSHHGGLLRFGRLSLASSSPEQFLDVTADGRVRTRPIKGTRPREADPVADARQRAELLASPKERAENLMIVDLMRNDLSRVCELGSVAVTALHQVESYPQVHQLVSTVEGRLRARLDALDVVEVAFPAGSMTGAPKRRAMEVLYELEAGPRGVYAGAFGLLAADGSLDLAMVIRSIVIDPHGASVGTGGGITALSIPEEELEETWTKAAAPLRALGVGRPGPESR
jgi:para-aminobenzoate synthetase component 1